MAKHEEHEERAKGGAVHHHGKGHSHSQHHAKHEGHVAHLHMHKKGGAVEKKRKRHESLNTGGVVARAHGGGIKPEHSRPKAEGTHANYPEVARVPREHRKIRVVKKHGGKVDGKKAERRIDKRARGGGISAGPASHHAPKHPGWPYSGAEAPDMPYTKGGANSKPEGVGKDPV